ncbi:hypothetical protein HBI56_201810 [Parastagonospora nodorum]|uniref:Uncharacterized protein n=1 Tax=Phaeosphaeria nodorum (strain SN15 / ATCC MYA-4574 / FGSC 10173) TaxID=321614 RepID=A0A7U2HXF1_PHANO|nr:hypothetical protein HBH56_216340 [Parastagonospora nodorum]QRC93929.1 hypothetical protein JI435_404790 [Parastagonospora nodorum SN15]KAH3922541.1 hypothetical protein HBH54_221180 [Parastagonospora nodorum]KAH3942089.1 hypothetical protein HBH53_191090 [Parastagonospora nodorum]KAH3961356.1 hypothetical protein HBH51_185020 [Parastagonospora nodorum]
MAIRDAPERKNGTLKHPASFLVRCRAALGSSTGYSQVVSPYYVASLGLPQSILDH